MLNDINALDFAINKFTDVKPVNVIMPAKIGGILSFVFKTPVTIPAIAPAHNATKQAKMGSAPPSLIKTALTIPPKVNPPSHVKSAKSSNLKDMYTPIVKTAQIRP